MDSDEEPTITDPAEAAWAAAQRARVIDYLKTQRVEHAGVSLEPRWFLCPYVAIWAVRSKAKPDRIGWWAISGDLPTDYVACKHEASDADVLLTFSRAWKIQAEAMSQGKPSPDYGIGPPERAKEFAPLLLTRAELLEEFAKDMTSDAAADEE
jgi:hypothetical protein